MNFSAHHPNHGAPAPIGYGEEFAKPPMQATRWLALGTVAGWACTLLLALSPLGVLWDNIFTLQTLAIHNLGVYVAAGTPVISFLIVGLVLRRVPSWKRFGTWMLLGCPLTLALIVGFTTAVPLSELAIGGGSIGLWQRALITEIQAWYVALGVLAFRRASWAA